MVEELVLSGAASPRVGDILLLSSDSGVSGGRLTSGPWLHELVTGAVVVDQAGTELLQAVSRIRIPGDGGGPEQDGWWVKVLHEMLPGSVDGVRVLRRGRSVAWVTLSDKGARGERVDTSGPTIAEMVDATLCTSMIRGFLLPDSWSELKAVLVDLALFQQVDLILTTGGTGVGPRDISPEATLAVIEKRLPGFEQVMTRTSLTKTPHGMISRAVAGTLGNSLIINLPGSPRAVAENLAAVLPAVEHTLAKLQGDSSDCARHG